MQKVKTLAFDYPDWYFCFNEIDKEMIKVYPYIVDFIVSTRIVCKK